jgi:cysteine desulfurase
MSLPIYLDYAATTPVDPLVAQAMIGCMTADGVFANPASRSHIYGWQAEEQVELARGHVAELLHCDSREVVWTSGATESNNLALKGLFESRQFKGHLISSVIEHKAVIDPALWLESMGVEVSWLRPNSDGIITAQQVREALREDTVLVSLMAVNNETGAVNPLAEIGAVCAAGGALFHVDAAQAVGKVSVDVQALNIDLMSLSAHKFYGPKGVGVLFVRRAIQSQLVPQIHGGGHERGMRSGTLATHQLVGVGEAARLVSEYFDSEIARIGQLRDRLWQGIADIPGLRRNGSAAHCSPNHLNVCFGGLNGETLMLSLRELAVSSGSACTSATMEPSYVLKAMGISDTDADSSLRLSLGRFTCEEDVDKAIIHIRTVCTSLSQPTV